MKGKRETEPRTYTLKKIGKDDREKQNSAGEVETQRGEMRRIRRSKEMAFRCVAHAPISLRCSRINKNVKMTKPEKN